MFLYDNFKWFEGLKYVFKNFWWQSESRHVFVSPFHRRAKDFRHGYPGKQDSSSPIGPF